MASHQPATKSCNASITHQYLSNFQPYSAINTLRPRENGRHFEDDIFKCIFVNENLWMPIKISLKFVPKGPINNIPALVQTMAWRRPGDKPLSEPMMVRLPTHICVTRPQWVKNPQLFCVLCWIRFNILMVMLSAWERAKEGIGRLIQFYVQRDDTEVFTDCIYHHVDDFHALYKSIRTCLISLNNWSIWEPNLWVS